MTPPDDAIYDEKGRYIAPPQTLYKPRPVGPWTGNEEQ
jgi:hypothetical protein